MDLCFDNRTALQYFSVGDIMKDEKVFRTIEKHREKNEMLLAMESLKIEMGMADENSEEMKQAHAGALTALKMLELELKGEKVW